MKDKAIKRGMIADFDLVPGDIVVQKYWTEYQPVWREAIFDCYRSRTRRDGVLLYMGVRRRIVDRNAKQPVGYVYCFWDFVAQEETWISHGYPRYLRGKTFQVLSNIKNWKKLMRRKG